MIVHDKGKKHPPYGQVDAHAARAAWRLNKLVADVTVEERTAEKQACFHEVYGRYSAALLTAGEIAEIVAAKCIAQGSEIDAKVLEVLVQVPQSVRMLPEGWIRGLQLRGLVLPADIIVPILG